MLCRIGPAGGGPKGRGRLSRTGVGDCGGPFSIGGQPAVEAVSSDILDSREEKSVIRGANGWYSPTVEREEMREWETELLEEEAV